ncbi:helix-turn-helix domain-containing protein [Neobacillus thermocopriae]|uniref:helix-turn-helix domain-containing protein n=1 Tax=Neobacillus thermocopriae TaxID=1215031 RepID=UPI002E1DD123|nr:helix-turn-helix domain-containing protein [Neobacillus thermocopriae]MED3715546.1 helix-turn-helix domain-containing protein [Neobacillus thermocopriae]
MDIKAINFKELQQYEPFSSIEEMDKSIYEYIDHIRKDVPQSVIDVLLCLGKASLRCVGLSFMKQATIAEQTGYSRKTINKALKTLETLGVVDSVRTNTKAGRPSVKVMRILPFCLERLQQGVTSYIGDNSSNDVGLTLIDDFEPIQTESQKQEKDIISDNKEIIEKVSILSTTIDLDGNLKNIVRYLALKIGDKVKNGLQIQSFSSYCEKVFSNEIRKFAVMKKIEETKKQKEESARRRFDNFVLKYFGEKFEDLGSFVQKEAVRMYKEITEPKPYPVPFYNWLEA